MVFYLSGTLVYHVLRETRGLPRVMLKLTKRSLQVERLRSLCGLDKAII